MNEEPSLDSNRKTILSRGVVARFDRTFGAVAGVILFVLMLVVTVDVIGRYIFNAPLHGSFEYIQICMALIVFIALPVIVVREENVQVEVFEVFIPRPLRRFTRIFGFALSTAIVAGLAWVAFRRAATFHASGERFVLLPAPLYPVAYFIFAMWLVCLLIMVFQFVKMSAHTRRPEDGQ